LPFFFGFDFLRKERRALRGDLPYLRLNWEGSWGKFFIEIFRRRKTMFFTERRDFKERELSPKVNTKIAWGEKLMLSYVTVQPNAPIVPLHSHPHEQMGLVLKGEVGLTIGSETRRLKKGDMFVIPPNVPHGLAMTFDQPAEILDVFSPPREEFKE
jgi:quercetin dioxygenase-like cupin family protein